MEDTMKPGWKSSEFWLLLAVAICEALLPMLESHKDVTWIGVILAVVSVAYAAMRTALKHWHGDDDKKKE